MNDTSNLYDLTDAQLLDKLQFHAEQMNALDSFLNAQPAPGSSGAGNASAPPDFAPAFQQGDGGTPSNWDFGDNANAQGGAFAPDASAATSPDDNGYAPSAWGFGPRTKSASGDSSSNTLAADGDDEPSFIATDESGKSANGQYGFPTGGGEMLGPVSKLLPVLAAKLYVKNPAHYQRTLDIYTGRKSTYDHRQYVVDFPNGQNVDSNIADALTHKADSSLDKKAYLDRTVRDGTVGDYGKNTGIYKNSNPVTNPKQTWERRQAANFNFGAMGAALGFGLNTMLGVGNALSLKNTGYIFGHLHPQNEQDAIEDGYWYFYLKHPAQAKADGVKIPAGIKFGYTNSNSVP